MMDEPRLDGWTRVALGELALANRPRISPRDAGNLPFVGMQHVEAQTMRLLGSVPASTMKSNGVRFEPGDVLYGRLRPYLNKVLQPDFHGLGSAEFIVLTPTDRVEAAYLKYLLNSGAFVRFASRLNTGDRPRVDFDQIADYPVPLPPLAEQRRIVSVVDQQLSRIEEATSALREAAIRIRRYRALILQAAWEGTLLAPKQTPAGIATVGLKNLTELVGADGLLKDGDWVESKDQDPAGEVRLTQLADIGSGRWLDKSRRYMTRERALSLGCTFLRPGDVLVARMPDPLARACIFPGDTRESVTAVDVCIARPDTALTDPQWLVWMINSPAFHQLAEALSAGSTRRRISRRNLATIAIPTPDLEVQQLVADEIERRMTILDDVASSVQTGLAHARALREAVLQRALSGHFSVVSSESAS